MLESKINKENVKYNENISIEKEDANICHLYMKLNYMIKILNLY